MTKSFFSQRDGADWSVYINTGVEMDGSDAGAQPDEAVTWGKLKPRCDSVKASFQFNYNNENSFISSVDSRCSSSFPSP